MRDWGVRKIRRPIVFGVECRRRRRPVWVADFAFSVFWLFVLGSLF